MILWCLPNHFLTETTGSYASHTDFKLQYLSTILQILSVFAHQPGSCEMFITVTTSSLMQISSMCADVAFCIESMYHVEAKSKPCQTILLSLKHDSLVWFHQFFLCVSAGTLSKTDMFVPCQLYFLNFFCTDVHFGLNALMYAIYFRKSIMRHILFLFACITTINNIIPLRGPSCSSGYGRNQPCSIQACNLPLYSTFS